MQIEADKEYGGSVGVEVAEDSAVVDVSTDMGD